jgi:hypothetical protein
MMDNEDRLQSMEADLMGMRAFLNVVLDILEDKQIKSKEEVGKLYEAKIKELYSEVSGEAVSQNDGHGDEVSVGDDVQGDHSRDGGKGDGGHQVQPVGLAEERGGAAGA